VFRLNFPHPYRIDHSAMPGFPASRLAGIAPFHVKEMLARAKALEAKGRDIIHMEVVEPDFPTPEPIIAAAQAHIATTRVSYTSALGLPELRSAPLPASMQHATVSPYRPRASSSPPVLLALCCWHWLAMPNPAANGC
jgi:hypothetical protein